MKGIDETEMNLRRQMQNLFRSMGYSIERLEGGGKPPVLLPLDRNGLEILADPAFQQSCHAVRGYTLLDTPRLANLWCLSRLTDPEGAMLEVGAYKGGGALHLSNCCVNRMIIVCDPFDADSFERVDVNYDHLFHKGQFVGSTEEAIADLLKKRNCTIIPGYFPHSIKGHALPRVSFIHLDVDVYNATKESLSFILSAPELCDNSLIVVDDFNRGANGVNQAIREVVEETAGTRVFPIFPGQALIVPARFQNAWS